MESILIKPNDTFKRRVLSSSHYLNNPIIILNENIHSLVRGYSEERSLENLTTYFKKYGYSFSKLKIKEIVHNFKSKTVKEISDMLSPLVWTELPSDVKEMNDKINLFYSERQRIMDSYHPYWRCKRGYIDALNSNWCFKEL